MKLLAIDTSGPVCGVAVLEDGRILYEGAAVNKLTHSVSLMPMVEEPIFRRSGCMRRWLGLVPSRACASASAQ